MDNEIKELSENAKILNVKLEETENEIRKVIVGQDYVINRLLLGLICNAHILLEGLPGLAKTTMVHTLASTIHSKFVRIQFTPDLLPADITGTKIYNQKTAKFTTNKGPIFGNFILADEINRAPPKVQSALLEAMQERQVTIAGDTLKLPEPFLVLATQNPIETEGTYPLPEAQVDRFMFKVIVGYPSRDEEIKMMTRMTSGEEIKIETIMQPEEIMDMQKFVHKIYVDDSIKGYVADLVFATRMPEKYGFDDLGGLIRYGASPRASIYLINAGKANALMSGRGYVVPDDIKEVAYDVLRHRIFLTYEAEAEEVTSDDLLKKIVDGIEVP